jgi:heme/copper-type cytochrome/quinol oxidase subunit 3
MAHAPTLQNVGGGHGGLDTGGHGAHTMHTSTSLDMRKILMWAFLASDCMFFGPLIANYLAHRGRPGAILNPPYPAQIFDIPYTSVSAFVLLISSLYMVLAVSASARGNMRAAKAWLLGTAGLGVIFLGGQFYEFTTFVHEGLGLTTNLFGSPFYVLTGFHGAHVTIGVLWLLCMVWAVATGKITQANAIHIEIAGLYWHFVDIVWIIIFTVVYLTGNPPAPPLH